MTKLNEREIIYNIADWMIIRRVHWKNFVQMHKDLIKQLEKVRKLRNFQVDKWVDKKTDLFNEYLRKSGLKGCVINISGGIDSAVTAALCLEAQKKKDSPLKKVIGIAQPIHSTEKIWKRAMLMKSIGLELVVVDQTKIFDELSALVDKAMNIKGEKFATGQLKSYMRTPVAFYAAQLLTQQGIPSVVMGTGNKDEDGYLFYFCKAGDGVADVQLIADLHKSEVFQVARYLKVPKEIIEAPPSADLWEGQTDEGELGFTYDFVELFTEYLGLDPEKQKEIKAECSDEAWAEFEKCAEMAKKVHNRNKHKEKYPYNINIL